MSWTIRPMRHGDGDAMQHGYREVERTMHRSRGGLMMRSVRLQKFIR